MGFNANAIRFLLEAHNDGVVFETCATLGRQKMSSSKNGLRTALIRTGFDSAGTGTDGLLRNSDGGNDGFAETFLKFCGAREIVSIDYSQYEGASYIHDMNTPVTESLCNRFSCVIDGGALTHIFNFPIAISNCMKMTKVGGHLLILTSCNNCMGHGMYQFSPELFWSVLSEKNGFAVEAVYIFETTPNATWYKVANPAIVHSRVELCNRRPTHLFVRAKKIRHLDLDSISAQQSDYEEVWHNNEKTMSPGGSRLFKIASAIKSALPSGVKKILRDGVNEFRLRFSNPFAKSYYTKYR